MRTRRQRNRLTLLTLTAGFLLLVGLGACVPSITKDELAKAAQKRVTLTPEARVPVDTPRRERGEGTPDLVIIAFSGHCGLTCSTRDNWSYLGIPSETTGGEAVLDGIKGTYERMGFRNVEVFSASSFVTAHYSGISDKVEAGYLQAQAYLDDVKRNLIQGVTDPARVVLVAHSHGTVWATLLALNNLDVTFDTMIYLDGICWMWWNKHKEYVREQFVDGPFPIPYPLDQGDPCKTVSVPGQQKRMDINDVVPANVIFGLEVRTTFRVLTLDPNVLADDDPNVRINGDTKNLWAIIARESHTHLGHRYSNSLKWLGMMLEALGVPDHGDYPMETFVKPAAPEGFDYREDDD